MVSKKDESQLGLTEQKNASVVDLSDKQKLSLYKKSQKSGYPVNILEEVYKRGVKSWDVNTNITEEQHAFSRVNSFIAGGKAYKLDKDLIEGNCEMQSKNPNDSSSRFIGTKSLTKIYADATPGQTNSTFGIIKKVVKEHRVLQERSLTDKEEDKKEDYVKGMKKKSSDFKERYGKDWKSVMYATATKMAKEEKNLKEDRVRGFRGTGTVTQPAGSPPSWMGGSSVPSKISNLSKMGGPLGAAAALALSPTKMGDGTLQKGYDVEDRSDQNSYYGDESPKLSTPDTSTDSLPKMQSPGMEASGRLLAKLRKNK